MKELVGAYVGVAEAGFLGDAAGRGSEFSDVLFAAIQHTKQGIGRVDERAFSQSTAALASSNARVAGRGFSPATAVVAVHEPLLG